MTVKRAAATAAEVDRVVIGVHRSVSDQAKAHARDAVAAVGLRSIEFWADLSVFMVEGRLTDEVVLARFRYSTKSAVAAIAGLRKRALVGDGGRPTDPFRSAIDVVESARVATAADLWQPSKHLAALAAGAAVMLRRGQGPLVEPYRALTEPADVVAALWHRLIGLRYLRADAHAAAWGDAGLTAAEVVDLTAAWRGQSVESPQPALRDRDLTSSSGAITETGAQLREDIEAATNERSETSYQGLDSRAWAGWMAAMAELPPQA